MEYLDFSSVITTIRNYISDAHSMNQIDMMYQLFVSFLSSDESLDFDFDNGLVCRWFNGQAKISPRITRYYMDNHNRNRLAADMHRNVLPLMYDSTMAVQEIYNILVQDTTISDKTKARLLENYPCETEMDEAVFLTSALCFGMERTFVKRDVNTKNLLSAGNLSPAVKDFIYDGGTPKPCRHFCGRDNELVTLHQLLCSHGKVFLQGIAGIGKSELAKAYAKIHSKEYTNILYLSYTGNLKQDISDMDFADDLPDDDNEERFRKHNRFLRTLKEDTLFIIDNFNTTASQDGLLSVVMKYRCRILFTTRSSFNTLAVIVHAVSASTNDTAFVIRGTNCTLPCANCLRKSATTQGTPFGCGSFIAEIGAAFTAPIFFFKKETKIVLRHRKEENSELFPVRSKSCESWRRPFCDSSCRLCILFPTLQ